MDPETPIISDTASSSMSAAPTDTTPSTGVDTSTASSAGTADASVVNAAGSPSSTSASQPVMQPPTATVTNQGSPDLSQTNINQYQQNSQADAAAKKKKEQQESSQKVSQSMKSIFPGGEGQNFYNTTQISAAYNAMFGVNARAGGLAPKAPSIAEAPSSMQSAAPQYQAPPAQAPVQPLPQPLQLQAMSDIRVKQNILNANPQIEALLGQVYKNVMAKRIK